MRILFAWIGLTDLRAPDDPTGLGLGPIAQALLTKRFDRAILLDNYPSGRTDAWLTWLHQTAPTPVTLHRATLTSPVHFGDIYRAATAAVDNVRGTSDLAPELVFHLSPGTPAMAAVWLLLAKGRYRAGLIESSREHGVRDVDAPFDIATDFLPDLLRDADNRLTRLAGGQLDQAERFGDIVYRSEAMRRVVVRAERVAMRSIPALILGESGTGKELLAKAIHNASPRSGKPFVPINCGAVPAELFEAEMFGHEKGAFTGASQSRAGWFEQANRGTLFLDEIGELPLAMQVKLLRVLQEGEVRRVGASVARKVDVRLVAATHRDLSADVAAGTFREDLFYRVAVAVLHLPPLRERPGDLPVLVDHLWAQVCREGREDPGWTDKDLSAGARKLLALQYWPGNVRDLLNTLRRAALWADGGVVTAADVQEALTNPRTAPADSVLGRDLGGGFDLPDLLASVARHYLERAIAESAGNKTRAAQLVGLASYQTLSNWLNKYGVPESPAVQSTLTEQPPASWHGSGKA